MPQPTTAEVRLDEHKAASFGPAGRASCRFGFQRVGCDRISLPRNPQGRKIATNNFGIREMSVYTDAAASAAAIGLLLLRHPCSFRHEKWDEQG